MRILLADAITLVRSGLASLIRNEQPSSEFIEATDFEEVQLALRSPASGPPIDLLVIDPELPGCDGEASLRALRDEFASLRIIVLALNTAPATILSYVTHGMNGYIPRTLGIAQTQNAIRTVLSGAVYIPFVLTQRTPAPSKPVEPPPLPASLPPTDPPPSALPFTGRQSDVLRLLAEGRTTKDIARELRLGVGTVKVHLAAVYRTLGAHSRMEAVIKAGALRH